MIWRVVDEAIYMPPRLLVLLYPVSYFVGAMGRQISIRSGRPPVDDALIGRKPRPRRLRVNTWSDRPCVHPDWPPFFDTDVVLSEARAPFFGPLRTTGSTALGRSPRHAAFGRETDLPKAPCRRSWFWL